MNDDSLKTLNVQNLLSQDKYIIPIYQRNYDWGECEALQLVEDVADYAKDFNDRNYYIGSLVVYPKNNGSGVKFETIDGQQRLTTLTILTTVLSHKGVSCAQWYKEPNLSYDNRDDATAALLGLKEHSFSEKPAACNIVGVYRIFEKNIDRILKEKGLDRENFAKYLFEKVVIVRVPVPVDTDLNHYFEIMNTRGEQLEEHEVLKANLMSLLDPTEHSLFNTIWEACSDMTSYVQMNMPVKVRKLLFTDEWNGYPEKTFDDLNKRVLNLCGESESDDSVNPRTIKDLFGDADKNIRYDLPRDGSKNEGKQDRFGSVIDFPNFLLQALKVMYKRCNYYKEDVFNEIRLDDKRLIQIFQCVKESLVSTEEKQKFAKQFIMELLTLRVEFDKFVIKRETVGSKESWSLKDLKKYDKSKVNYVSTFPGAEDICREIRMLEAMFHVSAPTQIYKHWLNAVLYFVHREKKQIDAKGLRDMLWQLAKAYMCDVYLAKDQKHSFEDIIYNNEFEPQNGKSLIDIKLIDKGCAVPNFVFNFYDFIIWQQNTNTYPKFEFTYRTSVEHFYPQNPEEGNKRLDVDVLNCFGNLCLISNRMNSRFGNNMPAAKCANFGEMTEVKNNLSLKLLVMMGQCKAANAWDENMIQAYDKTAKEDIEKALFGYV